MNTPNKLHPLLAVAAVSLTVASLVAIGVMTGFLPGAGAQNAQRTEEPAPAVAQAPATAPTGVPQSTIEHAKAAPPPRKLAAAGSSMPPPVPGGSSNTNNPPPVPPDYRPATPTCRECGTVESVREVVVQPTQGPGVGAVAGGVLGGVLGHQMGSGRGNDAATVLGAIGGAVAGHQIEKSKRRTVHYETTVRMDDGTIQTITAEYSPAWRGGERVKVTNGVVTPMI